MSSAPTYVGLDFHKKTIAVAIAEGQNSHEVRFWGNIENNQSHLSGLVRKLVATHGRIEAYYEAGPCGYDVLKAPLGNEH